jgi:hypothetical protein
MSNLPKKAEDRVNVFGIVLIGIASAILIWASAVALQAYYMNTAGPMETERDQINLASERRSVEAAQQARLSRLAHNDAVRGVDCVSNPIEVAMTAVVGDAQRPDVESLVPAVGPHDKPTIEAAFGYPIEPTATAPADGAGDQIAAIEGDVVVVPAPIVVGTDGKLAPGSGLMVAAVAELMSEHPEIEQLTVNAYTDDRGVEVDLLERTQARAQIVVEALTRAGVDVSRLRAVGNGSVDPIADNATAEGRAANNRIELAITARGEAPPDDAPADPDGDAPADPETPAPTPAPPPPADNPDNP